MTGVSEVAPAFRNHGKHMGGCIKDCFREHTIPASAQPAGKIKEDPQVVSAAGGAQVVCPTAQPDNGKLLPPAPQVAATYFNTRS